MRKIVTIPLALWAAPALAQSADPVRMPAPATPVDAPADEADAPPQTVQVAVRVGRNLHRL